MKTGSSFDEINLHLYDKFCINLSGFELISVVFSQGGDDLPMFGICYYVNQMVHTPPGLARQSFSEQKLPLTRYLVAAPRCYCILSRYPFFDLHFQVRIVLQYWDMPLQTSRAHIEENLDAY